MERRGRRHVKRERAERTLEMAFWRVGFGAVFLAPKRRFMVVGWSSEVRETVA